MKAAELFDLGGHVSVVTGAASGIGLAIAEVLAANGAHVLMSDINEDALHAAERRLSGAGYGCEAAVVDVTKRDQVDAYFAMIGSKYDRLDSAFVNAGISGGPGYGKPDGVIDRANGDLWEASLSVNLTGAFHTMQAVSHIMKRQKRGSIIVTSSVAALKASHLPSYGYHASKAGIAQVVRVAALELAHHNIRVNSIAPGPFPTNIGGGRMHTPEGGGAFAATVPLGRMANLQEIKGIALLLASSASSYMTGAIIPVDGGTQA